MTLNNNDKKDKKPKLEFEQFNDETVVEDTRKLKEEKLNCSIVLEDGTKVPISSTSFTIGRSPDCHLPMNHTKVSRIHCRITKVSDSYILEDLGSSNGTKVNGRKVKKAILRHNDEISLGEAVYLRFHII